MLDVGLPSCRSSPSTYIWPAHQKGTPSTYIWSCSKLQSHQKGPALTFTSMVGTINYHLWNGSALTSDLLVRKALPSRQEHILSQWWKTPTQTRTNPITVVEDFSTFIQTRTNPITVMKDSHPDKNQSYHSGGRFPALTSIQTRTHPITVMERLALTSDPTRTHLRSHIRMAPSPPRLSYMVTDHAPPLSRRVAISLTSVLLDRMASTHIWHGRN